MSLQEGLKHTVHNAGEMRAALNGWNDDTTIEDVCGSPITVTEYRNIDASGADNCEWLEVKYSGDEVE